MSRRRRAIEVFTLSFLDCICCGFGAVILFYTIVSAQSSVVRVHKTDDLTAEVNQLNAQVVTGNRDLVALRDMLQKTQNEIASASEQTNRIAATLHASQEQVSAFAANSTAHDEHIAKLKADIRSLQEGAQRLEAGSDEQAPVGQDTVSFRKSGGERRYITGIRMHGKRILILLDSSASMLHEDLITVLRLRNEDDAHKRAAAKWRRAVDTVDWLLSQIPPGSSYQILTFNTHPQPLRADMEGKWIAAGDTKQITRDEQAMQALVPADGTSLYNVFAATRSMGPPPDQMILITDGLPTQGRSPPTQKYVTSEARLGMFDEAAKQLLPGVPLDTILLPMKGDPEAAHRFWDLARTTNGTLLMPAKDWP